MQTRKTIERQTTNETTVTKIIIKVPKKNSKIVIITVVPSIASYKRHKIKVLIFLVLITTTTTTALLGNIDTNKQPKLQEQPITLMTIASSTCT